MMDGLKHSAMGSPAPVHVKERLFMEVHMVCTRGHYGFFRLSLSTFVAVTVKLALYLHGLNLFLLVCIMSANAQRIAAGMY